MLSSLLLLLLLVVFCVSTPISILPEGGKFYSPIYISIISELQLGDELRYTVDGRAADANSLLYTEPFLLDELGITTVSVAQVRNGEVKFRSEARYIMDLSMEYEISAGVRESNGFDIMAKYRVSCELRPCEQLELDGGAAAIVLSIGDVAVDQNSLLESHLRAYEVMAGSHNISLSVLHQSRGILSTRTIPIFLESHSSIPESAAAEYMSSLEEIDDKEEGGRGPIRNSIIDILRDFSESKVAIWATDHLKVTQDTVVTMNSRRVNSHSIVASLSSSLSQRAVESRITCNAPASLGLSSYCIYDRALCMDAAMNVIIIDDLQVGRGITDSDEADVHPSNHLNASAVHFARKGNRGSVPFRSHLQGKYESSSFLAEQSIHWIEPFTFVGSSSAFCSRNLHVIAAAILVGWEYILHNKENVAEPFDYMSSRCSLFEQTLLLCSSDEIPVWVHEYIHVALGEEYCNPIMDIRTFKDNNALPSDGSPRDYVCFHRAFVPGSDAALFHGPEDAQKFRDRFWLLGGKAFFPGAIILQPVYIRQSNEVGMIINEAEMLLAIEQNVGIPVKIADFSQLTMIEQVNMMSAGSLVISTHGPALANCIFNPPGSVVIELFPALFASDLYHHVSVNSGHWYLQHQSNMNETVFSKDMEALHFTAFSTRACMDSLCAAYAHKSNFTVNIDAILGLINHAKELMCYEYPCGEGSFPCNVDNRYSTCDPQFLKMVLEEEAKYIQSQQQ